MRLTCTIVLLAFFAIVAPGGAAPLSDSLSFRSLSVTDHVL